MSELRIAVVGAGVIGQEHVRVIRSNSQLRLLALVDPSPQAQAVAAQAQVPLYVSLDELLVKAQPDGVVLATPNPLHVPQALHCIERGLPVLLEKPMATSEAEGFKLLQAVEKSQARVLVGHHRAHSPILAAAREVVASGQLGQLVAVMGSATFYKPDLYFQDGPWRSQPGGGPIQINMVHEVHSLRLLCGEIVAVQAFASNAVRGFRVEDTVAINLRFASGALGTFMLSDTAACARSWEQTSQENQAYASYPDEDCYVIAGTQGSLSVPTLRIKRYRQPDRRSWMDPFEESVVAIQRADPLVRQMAHFAQVIRGEEPPRVTVLDGYRNQRVVGAIAQAAQTGQLVELGN